MDVNTTILKIKQRLNKLDSSDYDNIQCWQIREAVNKAQLEWIRRQIHGVNLVKEGDIQPKKTNALERCFNRALTQVLFTGRRTISVIDLYLAMTAETNSHAHYFLLKYGVKKKEFVEFYQKTYNHNDAKITDQQAKIGRAHV